jgi:hypothetical protein
VDAGRISRDDYARVVEAVRTLRCKEGAALLGLGLVAPRELYEALKQQVRRRLLDCLGWPRGNFALETGTAPVEDATAFRCDPIPLVQEAVAVHWSPATLRAQLGAKLDAYAVATPRTEALVSRLFRDADVDAFVAGLGGDAPLAAQLDALRAPTALAAAWVLDALGALAYRDRPASDAARDGAGNPDRPDIEIFVRDPEAAASRASNRHSGPAQLLNPRTRRPPSSKRCARKSSRSTRVSKGATTTSCSASRATPMPPPCAAPTSAPPNASIPTRSHGWVCSTCATWRKRCSRGSPKPMKRSPIRNDAATTTACRKAPTTSTPRASCRPKRCFARPILLRAPRRRAEFLRPAVAMWPNECAYQSALGWALYKKTPPDQKSAREHLERAATLDRDDAVAHFRLSVVLRALGEKDAAETAAARAKQLDPKVRS